MKKKPEWVYHAGLTPPWRRIKTNHKDCRHKVRSGEYLNYQCCRAAVEKIDGYGICKQHAWVVRRRND